MFEKINWGAYAVAVVAQIMIGYFWYHKKVMGTMYASAQGKDYDSMKPSNPGLVYGLTILFTLIFTVYLCMNVTGPGQDGTPEEPARYHTFQHGVAHAVFFSIFIFIPILGTLALHEGKNWKWFVVHFGHWFLRFAVAGGIISLWR